MIILNSYVCAYIRRYVAIFVVNANLSVFVVVDYLHFAGSPE